MNWYLKDYYFTMQFFIIAQSLNVFIHVIHNVVNYPIVGDRLWIID